jgi:hypothetical protein
VLELELDEPGYRAIVFHNEDAPPGLHLPSSKLPLILLTALEHSRFLASSCFGARRLELGQLFLEDGYVDKEGAGAQKPRRIGRAGREGDLMRTLSV